MKHSAILISNLIPDRQSVYHSVVTHPQVDYFNGPAAIHGSANSSWTTVSLARELLENYDDIINDCTIQGGLEFVAVRPNLVNHKHKDDLGNANGFARRTLLMIPLSYESLTPCDYYDDDGNMIETCDPKQGCDWLHDTQAWHAFTNGPSLRLHLEFGFNEDFETVYTLIAKGKLFRNYEVSVFNV